MIERCIDKHGQQLLVPDIELEGWCTGLLFDEETIIALHAAGRAAQKQLV